MDELYKAMAKHPDTGPVMELLDMVEPVDEFSRALCLVRDCFSPDSTLRVLSRDKLRGLLASRVALMTTYQQAMIDAVPGVKTFDAAIANGPPFVVNTLRASFERQVAELMGRPLREN